MDKPPSAADAPKVSAALITLNAQAHLRECLASLQWCDEIVVVDNGSRDDTLAICAEFGARVIQTPDWPGFGPQKNRAISAAHGEWIFSIDADEICSEALRAALHAGIAQAAARNTVAFELPRRSNFCGHWIHHSGWWPDHVVRVFKRGAARFSDDLVHERLLVDGAITTLTEPLLHYTYDNFEQALAKLDRYSTLGAEQAFARGKRASPLSALARGGWAVFRTYVLRLGFLDGWAGVMLALYNGHGTYYRYLKLWLLARRAALRKDRPV